MAKDSKNPKKKLSIMEEEQIFSPWRTAFNNFLTKKLSVACVFVFLTIFCCCVFLPFIFPLDKSFYDTTQENIRPSFSIMSIPSELAKNAKVIDVGSTFGVGIDNDGKLYQWGILTDKLKNVPENMGKLEKISAGLDHVLAISESGKLYTWGNNRMGLSNVPMELMMGVKVVDVKAGHQVSTALDDKGKLYVWGNENITSIVPRIVKDQIIVKHVVNTTTAIVLLDDKTVAALTSKETAYNYIPEEIQGKVKDIATTDRAAAALLDDGTVVVWGSTDFGVDVIPEKANGHITTISGGRNHFTAILDDNSVVSWGKNDKGQINYPNIKNIKSIGVGYYQNYAIDNNNKVHKWGLKGYLMGSDQMGRDIFVRLLYAGRLTMTVGAIAVVIQALIGIFIGGISGYFGGRIDIFLMRFAEIVNAIPFLPIAIILSAIIGNSIPQTGRIVMIMCILGILGWPGLARLTRAQMLAERENEFVTAAKAMGIKELAIIFRHILPNVLPVILVSLTLGLATSMLTESSLSFLGFGVIEPSPTWGNMLNSCVDSTVMSQYWWRWVFPSLALGLSTLSINKIGDGLRDAVDPKSNDR